PWAASRPTRAAMHMNSRRRKPAQPARNAIGARPTLLPRRPENPLPDLAGPASRNRRAEASRLSLVRLQVKRLQPFALRLVQPEPFPKIAFEAAVVLVHRLERRVQELRLHSPEHRHHLRRQPMA